VQILLPGRLPVARQENRVENRTAILYFPSRIDEAALQYFVQDHGKEGDQEEQEINLTG
jgi:hypothetical protein